MPPLITFLSDYGATGPYVAEVKGVIKGICPQAEVLDITHQVPPWDVHAGAFLWGMVWGAFPPGTVHLGVVDPGVGTARLPLVLVTPHALFVGPDNGLFTYILRPLLPPMREGEHPFLAPVRLPLPPTVSAYVLADPRWMRRPVSTTFHGRDVFGPCAAWLAKGIPPGEMGPPVREALCFWVPEPSWREEALEGRVLAIDPFGNLLTSIREHHLRGYTPQSLVVEVGGLSWRGLAATYAEGEWTAHFESHGWLEIARREGNAAATLGVKVGQRVRVRWAPP
jgi:S-adenosylmethionine hydrolase